jgi:hypothetical protein
MKCSLHSRTSKQQSESESELLYDWRFTANQFALAPSPGKRNIMNESDLSLSSGFPQSPLQNDWKISYHVKMLPSKSFNTLVVYHSMLQGLQDPEFTHKNSTSFKTAFQFYQCSKGSTHYTVFSHFLGSSEKSL